MPAFIDLSNRKFGMLKVIERVENGKDGATRYLCECKCGKRKIIRSKHLKSGAIQDCGCMKSARTSERNFKHGDCRARLYNIWIKMRNRCSNPKCKDWNSYGGRGIKVCSEWQESYFAFRDWAYANGYDESKSIDRIDVNNGYSPENCRWADDIAQANNKRSNHVITYQGEKMSLADAARLAAVPYDTLKRRISCGWDVEKAVDTPALK